MSKSSIALTFFAANVATSTYIDQVVCSDTSCSQQTTENTFNLNECIGAAVGGSMMFLQCDGSGAIYNLYSEDNCAGVGDRNEDPVGQCLSASAGGSFINLCESGVAATNSNQAGMTAGSLTVSGDFDKEMNSSVFTCYGPNSKLYSDADCENIGGRHCSSSQDAVNQCGATNGCNAFNFDQHASQCYLRACSSSKLGHPTWDDGADWVSWFCKQAIDTKDEDVVV